MQGEKKPNKRTNIGTTEKGAQKPECSKQAAKIKNSHNIFGKTQSAVKQGSANLHPTV